MTNQEILSRLANVKRGRYISLKKKKVLKNGIEKISDLVIRLGVEYANMKINEGRQTGSLPWGHWVEGLEGLVIEHKGNYYLRVASSYSNNKKIVYIKDGVEIDERAVIALLGGKEEDVREKDVYNIKFENILALGEE